MATAGEGVSSRKTAVRLVGNAMLAVLFAAWLAAMTWYVWPRSEAELRPGAAIIAPRHEVIRAASLVLLALLCATVVWLFVGARWGRRLTWQRQVGLLALQIGLVFGLASPILVMLWHGYNAYCRPWRDISELRAADGETYRIQLLANTSALTEEGRSCQFFLRSRVIGWTEPRDKDVPVVRPAGDGRYGLTRLEDDNGGGRLLQSRDGRWVVFAYRHTIRGHSTDPKTVARPTPTRIAQRIDCLMSLAYDTQQGEFYAGASLLELSPFLLIGGDDELNEDDIEGLVSIQRYPSNLDDRWQFGPIAEGAAHANASVRRVAARMLGEYWDEYEAAQATLKELAESDPDEAVRGAAAEALATLDERRAEYGQGAE